MQCTRQTNTVRTHAIASCHESRLCVVPSFEDGRVIGWLPPEGLLMTFRWREREELREKCPDYELNRLARGIRSECTRATHARAEVSLERPEDCVVVIEP